MLIDLATKVAPGIEVVFLDTEAHFPETLAFVEEMRARYDLNLTVTKPGPEAAAYPCGSAQCCQFRKVEPAQAGRGGEGGLADVAEARRRPDPRRHAHRHLGRHLRAGQGQPAGHVDRRRHHGLLGRPRPAACTRCWSQGYLSIGCAPTTRPVAEGEDARAGRWSGLDKTECGLHV